VDPAEQRGRVGIGDPEPLPAHVDLDKHLDLLGREPRAGVGDPLVRHCGEEPVFFHHPDEGGIHEPAAVDEQRQRHASAAEDQRVGQIGDRDHVDAGVLKRPAHRQQAEAVAVGFHRGQQANVRSDDPPDLPHVVRDRAEVDLEHVWPRDARRPPTRARIC
jgi:hypothetical protein